MPQLEQRQRPGVVNTGATEGDWAGNLSSVPSLRAATTELTFLQARVPIEAVCNVWPAYWERRARQLEHARPVPGEYVGRATAEELSARWRALTAAAEACRAKGRMVDLLADDLAADLQNVLSEVAA